MFSCPFCRTTKSRTPHACPTCGAPGLHFVRVSESVSNDPGLLALDRAGAIADLVEFEDWRAAMRIGPKDWQDGRSAKELARHWMGAHRTCPSDVLATLRGGQGLSTLTLGSLRAEYPVSLDGGRGPARLDLAALGTSRKQRVLVAVEAKTSEPFGPTLSQQYASALRKTGKVRRLDELTESLFSGRHLVQVDPELAQLRYQLLTLTAASVRAAEVLDADLAVVLIHEFVHGAVAAKDRARNAGDLQAFLKLLDAEQPDISTGGIAGPYNARLPDFLKSSQVPLYVAKVVTKVPGSYPRPVAVRRRRKRRTPS